MSEEDKVNEDSKEPNKESGIEIDDDVSQPIQVDVRNTSNESSELLQSEIEVGVTDVVAIEELPDNESRRTSKSPCSEVSKVDYEYPDDSEFCKSVESFPKLRKRSSNSSLESTSKKACNEELKSNFEYHTLSEVKDKKTITSADEDKGGEKSSSEKKDNKEYVGQQNQINAFLFGCKHKREGETRRLENVIGRDIQSPGRFTKHKGDNKCHHGTVEDCAATCSSDEVEADVEDNADDSDTVTDNSSESPTRNPRKQPLNAKDNHNAKPHHLPATSNKKTTNSSKTVARPEPISNSAKTTDDEPHKDEESTETSSGSKSQISSPDLNPLKVRSQVTRQKKRKCRVCRKKLGLTAISCRCGGLFCAKHRYDKEHNCTYDYRAMGAEEIRKNNPKVIAEKIKKI